MEETTHPSNNKELQYHHFRLFSYFSTAIISVMIILFFYFIFQHVNMEDEQQRFIANQNTVLENQILMKQLINESRSHEDREESMLGSNTNKNIEISKSNSERLDMLLEHFNLTYSH